MPKDVLKEKCKRYLRNGKARQRPELINESDYAIVSTYQLEYRGIVNYYRLAFNLHTASRLTMDNANLTPQNAGRQTPNDGQ